MARSKFRLFHLILEICKSRLSHFAHPAHVVTYTFRKKNGWGLEEFCGDPPGFHILDIGFFVSLGRSCIAWAFAGSWGLVGLLSVLSAYNPQL